jgi:hypothetical protein
VTQGVSRSPWVSDCLKLRRNVDWPLVEEEEEESCYSWPSWSVRRLVLVSSLFWDSWPEVCFLDIYVFESFGPGWWVCLSFLFFLSFRPLVLRRLRLIYALPSLSNVTNLIGCCMATYSSHNSRVKLTTHLQLVPRSKNEWIYTSTPPIRLHGVVLS